MEGNSAKQQTCDPMQRCPLSGTTSLGRSFKTKKGPFALQAIVLRRVQTGRNRRLGSEPCGYPRKIEKNN